MRQNQEGSNHPTISQNNIDARKILIEEKWLNMNHPKSHDPKCATRKFQKKLFDVTLVIFNKKNIYFEEFLEF